MSPLVENVLLFGIPGILLVVLIYFMFIKKSSTENENTNLFMFYANEKYKCSEEDEQL